MVRITFVSRCGRYDWDLFEGYEPRERDLLILTIEFIRAFCTNRYQETITKQYREPAESGHVRRQSSPAYLALIRGGP
jgi:hypothetical protein